MATYLENPVDGTDVAVARIRSAKLEECSKVIFSTIPAIPITIAIAADAVAGIAIAAACSCFVGRRG